MLYLTLHFSLTAYCLARMFSFILVQRVRSLVCTCKIDVKMTATHVYIWEHHHSTWHPVCMSISPCHPACIQGYKRSSGLSQARIRPETNRVVCPRHRNYLQGQTGSAVQCVNTRLQPLIRVFTRVWSGGFSAGWGMWIHCTLHYTHGSQIPADPANISIVMLFSSSGCSEEDQSTTSKRQRDFIHISNL